MQTQRILNLGNDLKEFFYASHNLSNDNLNNFLSVSGMYYDIITELCTNMTIYSTQFNHLTPDVSIYEKQLLELIKQSILDMKPTVLNLFMQTARPLSIQQGEMQLINNFVGNIDNLVSQKNFVNNQQLLERINKHGYFKRLNIMYQDDEAIIETTKLPSNVVVENDVIN